MTVTATPSKLKFRVKKHVTRTLIKFELDTEYYLKIDGEIHEAEKEIASRAPKEGSKASAMAAPHLADVIDLETGEIGEIIVPAVLKAELEGAYPDASYVGKNFLLAKHKIEGKAYSTWTIQEIELDSDDAVEEPKKSAKK